MMKETKMTIFCIDCQGKGKWSAIHETSDQEQVYYSLAQDLIAKKICGCTYIKKIVRYSNYDGTQTIKVYFDNYVMRHYVVKN